MGKPIFEYADSVAWFIESQKGRKITIERFHGRVTATVGDHLLIVNAVTGKVDKLPKDYVYPASEEIKVHIMYTIEKRRNHEPG